MAVPLSIPVIENPCAPSLTIEKTLDSIPTAVTLQASNPSNDESNRNQLENGRKQDNSIAVIAAATTAMTMTAQPLYLSGTEHAIHPLELDWSQQSIQDNGLNVNKEQIKQEELKPRESYFDLSRDGTQRSLITPSFHTAYSAADTVSEENLVSHPEIISPKLDPPKAKDLFSKKSFTLPHLQTSSSTIKQSIPITTAAIQTATIDAENSYFTASITPISATISHPHSTLSHGLQPSYPNSGPSSDRSSHLEFESPYPSPTPVTSPIDYFSNSWILPPIPSISEMDLTFDKSRSSSANSDAKLDASDYDHSYRGNSNSSSILRQQNHIICTTAGEPHCSSMDQQSASHSAVKGDQRLHHGIIPHNYDPSIFDQILSDENEAYILWSTTPESGNGSAAVSASIIETSPAVSLPRNKSGAILSPTAGQQQQQSMSSPEFSSTAKHWSIEENSKVKNQGRDSFDHDRGCAQTPTATTPCQESYASQPSTAHAHGVTSDSISSSSQPSSPNLIRHSERFNGSASMGKASLPNSATSSYKAHTKGTVNSGTPHSSITGRSMVNQEGRVIMAATIEKLVEKLTSDIDYTFLTDFFLIYRLFISPPALLQLLMARFHWALTENTPQRQIVRIRTFVVLRHWLLNYFEHDFMGFRLLRRTLIQNLKKLNTHPIICASVRDQRIVQELRRLFQLKRKQYSHAVAQLSLEGSAAKRDRSNRSLQHDDEDYNGEEQPSLEEQMSDGESSDDDSELYSTDSQSEYDDVQESNHEDNDEIENEDEDGDEEDGMYEEVSKYVIGYPQRDMTPCTFDKDSSDFDDEEPTRGRRRLSGTTSSKGRLPSPTFSVGSNQSNDITSEPLSPSQYYYRHHHLTETDTIDNASGKSHSRPRNSESSENSPHYHHHRSHKVPHLHGARHSPRPRPRPLSYISPSIDTSSSYIFSPPESPLPLETYSSNRPLQRAGSSSNDKKKTWSQYMAATVGQLSKVKRVFKHKTSQSSQDLRNGASSTTTSFQPLAPRGNGAAERETNKFGTMKSAVTSSKHWNEGQSPNDYKASQSMTMLDALTMANSVTSSLDGYHGIRDEHDENEYEDEQWSSNEDDDNRSESTRKSASDCANSRARSHRNAEHNLTFQQLSSAQNRSYGGSRNAIVAATTRGTMEYGYGAMDDDSHQQQHQGMSTPTSPRGAVSDTMSDDQDIILSPRSSASSHRPIPTEWDQGPSSEMSSPSNQRRVLRRTAPKRDNRASWMTFSSTSSSVFGAVLSHGHMPPSQAIRERGESQNVERFMERTYGSISSAPIPPLPVSPSGEKGPAYRPVTRHKSTEALQGRHTQQGAAKAIENDNFKTPTELIEMNINGLSEESTHQTSNPGMDSRRGSNRIAQHPHRQTVPILHHHYHHHHYLQHHQSMQDYQPQRRHSTDVQILRGWSAGTTTTTKDKRNSAELSRGTSHSSGLLLEGAAYAAALQETHRKLKLLNSQEGGHHHRAAPSPPPVTIPPHSQTFRGYSNGGPKSPDFSVSNKNRISVGEYSEPGRTYSNPNWRHLSDPDAGPFAIKSSPKLNSTSSMSASTGGTTQLKGVQRISMSWYSPTCGGQQSRTQYENSYNQQRSPMNPRFQSILSPSSASSIIAREYVRAPTSIVLRYRSETIAQQMCLIEREQLSEIKWYELVNAGWKKKSDTSETKTPAPSLIEDQQYHRDNETVEDDTEGYKTNRRNSTTCNWVTSEVLKSIDLETRVKVIEKFIRIAHICYTYHNFSSLTQIMLGLQAHEVSRLNRTWARVRSQETKMMEDLVEFTSPFHNWKHLRSAMKIMADEWGGAATGQDPVPSPAGASSTSTSGSGSGSIRKSRDMGGLFSKIALSGKDKEKQKEKELQLQFHQQQQSLTSNHGANGSKSLSVLTGHSSSHTKSFSGPVFPSLVSTLGNNHKDKDKDSNRNSGLAYQLPIGGCIPFLGVYLSDLLYNTELPSFIEPKVPAVQMDMHPTLAKAGNDCLSNRNTTSGAPIQTLPLDSISASNHTILSEQQHYHPLDTTASVLVNVPNVSANATIDGVSSTMLPSSFSLALPSPSLSQSLSTSFTSSSSVSPAAQTISSQFPPPPPSCSIPVAMTTTVTSTETQDPLQYLPSPPPQQQQQRQYHHHEQQSPWMVNMHKHRTIATIIRRILSFQKMAGRYPFLHDAEVYEALIRIDASSEQLTDSEKERLSDMYEERMSFIDTSLSSPISVSASTASGLTSPALPR
ncbi:hypothetical protein FBU30_007645 [Linnemannia zychae]|nr:hypothetical protein FBU30_007645 [Linnemannia zychae]